MSRLRLGEILVNAGVLTGDQLQAGLREQRKWGGPLGKVLVRAGLISEDLLVRALSKQLKIPIAQIEGVSIAEKVLSHVPRELAEQYGVIPFQQQAQFLDVAMSDPMNMGIIDELRIRTQLNVRPHLAGSTAIQEAIYHCYGGNPEHAAIDVEFAQSPSMSRAITQNPSLHEIDPAIRAAQIPPKEASATEMRNAEVAALQLRLSNLEALVSRDENVIRKLLGLLVRKGVASREEILLAIK